MEVSRPVEPVLAVEIGDLDNECVPLPSPHRMPHVSVVRRSCGFIEMDHPRCVGKCVGHLYFVSALDDLKRVRHVHRARNARQVALELGIAVYPMLSVLPLHRRRFRLVRNLAVTFHDANRRRNAGGGAERHHGRSSDLRILVRVNAPLRHHSCSRAVGLQIPICFVIGLPNAIEIRFAAHGRDRPCGCTGSSCPPKPADSTRGNDRHDYSPDRRAFEAGWHDFSSSHPTGDIVTLLSQPSVTLIRFAPPIAADWRQHPRRQNLRRILHNRRDTVLRGSAPGLLQTRAPIHERPQAVPPCRSCLRDIAARNKSDCLRPSASSARA